MWPIITQPLQKHYYVPILSRGFFISAICYIIAFLLPILILISIGYSWSSNTKQLTKPIIKYQNYQLHCLLPSQKIIYDSSFNDDDTAKSYLSVVSVGTDQSTFSISLNTFVNVIECTIMTYNRILLNDNYETTVMLPFSFSQSTSSTLVLNSITQYGKIQVFSSGALIDTTIPYTQTTYNKPNEDFSAINNFVAMGSKNISAYIDVATQSKSYGSLTSLQYNGLFEIESQILIKEASLLNNIRTIVPFYIFIWFPLLFFGVIPLIQWMFSSKLYYSKCDKDKIKLY